MNNYIPDRHDIVWIGLKPQKGREQAKRRPFLILSPREYNAKAGLLIGCPITSKIKGHPFEVKISQPKEINGAILADQIKSLDWKERNADFITTTDPKITEQVITYIKLLLEG
ncbi:MAG: type II toxin-antitoxin system PemK/MazF family toxin [Proteobacteria bacterium]|nr:type II toxin-antitoxin system PemK/MazF family toxin [Pseudomonadota bacterium]